MAKYTASVALTDEQKELVDRTQEVLGERDGHTPTKSEAVAIACRQLCNLTEVEA